MTSTKSKKRTITLTDRPPVKIVDDEWDIIASDSDRVSSSMGSVGIRRADKR